jgi:hypothetical protein
MSGGSMDYFYLKVEWIINDFAKNTPERSAFAKHLLKISKALKDIEWVDSGDSAPGSESASIRVCLQEQDILSAAIEEAEHTIENLQNEIKIAKELLENYD